MRVTSVHKRKVARRRSSHAQTDSTEAQPSRAYGRAYPSMLRRAARGVSIWQSGATPHSALDDLVLWTTSCTWPSFWLVARILLLLPRCSLPLLLCGWCAGGGGGAPASVMAAHAFSVTFPRLVPWYSDTVKFPYYYYSNQCDPVFSKFFRLTALFCDETVHRRLSTAHVSTAHVSTADSVALVQTTSAALLLALASRSVLRLATPARAWRAHAVLCSSAHAQRMQCPSPHLHARAKLTCPCARS